MPIIFIREADELTYRFSIGAEPTYLKPHEEKFFVDGGWAEWTTPQPFTGNRMRCSWLGKPSAVTAGEGAQIVVSTQVSTHADKNGLWESNGTEWCRRALLPLAQVTAMGAGGVAAVNAAGQVVNKAGSPVSGDPIGEKTRVLVIGSSNAAGSASTVGQSWVNLLASAYSATHAVSNYAIPGRSPGYWVDQTVAQTSPVGAEKTALETAIAEVSPAIVFICFATQNSIYPTDTGSVTLRTKAEQWFTWLKKAIGIVRRSGAKPVVTTPYISTAYLPAQRAIVRELAQRTSQLGVEVLDWEHIWHAADTDPIPAAVDSGDGLHLNNAGHLAQFRSIPASAMQVGEVRIPERINPTAGLRVADPETTVGLVRGNALGPGSWSLGFFHRCPKKAPHVHISAYLHAASNTRLRSTDGAAWEIADSVGTRVLSTTPIKWDDITEYHIQITYSAVHHRVRLYQDGVLCGEYSPAAGVAWDTGISVFSHLTSGSFNAAGHSFRGLTVHKCELLPADVRRQSLGEVVNRSLVAVFGLSPAASGGIVSGESIPQEYGYSYPLTAYAALSAASAVPSWAPGAWADLVYSGSYTQPAWGSKIRIRRTPYAIEMQGQISGEGLFAAGDTIATMPAGFAALSMALRFPTAHGGGMVQLSLNPDGTLKVDNRLGYSATMYWVSLDGVSIPI